MVASVVNFKLTLPDRAVFECVDRMIIRLPTKSIQHDPEPVGQPSTTKNKDIEENEGEKEKRKDD